MYTRWLPFINNKKVILASGSPQRQSLLKELGINFTSKTSDFPENLEKTNPKEYVENTCLKKFQEFIKNNNNLDYNILITADTIVEKDNTIMEKPNSKEDIYNWFHKYSNNKIICLTSVVIGIIARDKNNNHYIVKHVQFTNSTNVLFDTITDEMISDYIKTGEPFNKAGGFAIQGIGRSFIKGIEGCYYNVVGFPVNEFCEKLVNILKDAYGEDGWKQA